MQGSSGISADATDPQRPGSTGQCSVTASETNPIFSEPSKQDSFLALFFSSMYLRLHSQHPSYDKNNHDKDYQDTDGRNKDKHKNDDHNNDNHSQDNHNKGNYPHTPRV